MLRPALIGTIATILAALAYVGPLGGGARIAAGADRIAATTLDYYEMKAVRATMARGPDRREMLMAGTADDFQRQELVRIMGEVPGIASARWTDDGAATPAFPARPLPLMVEAALLALLCFGAGWLVAYLLALRQRSRAWDRI